MYFSIRNLPTNSKKYPTQLTVTLPHTIVNFGAVFRHISSDFFPLFFANLFTVLVAFVQSTRAKHSCYQHSELFCKKQCKNH